MRVDVWLCKSLYLHTAGGRHSRPKKEKSKKGTGAVVFLLPPPKPIFSLSEWDFLRIGDRSCLSAPPSTLERSARWRGVCEWLSCQRSVVQVVELTRAVRGQRWDYPVGGFVNELVSACESVRLSPGQVLIESVEFKL